MERKGYAEVRGSGKFYSTKIVIMKRIFFLFILLLSLNAVAQTGTNIFFYGPNGEVIPVNTFITNGIMTWENDTLVPYRKSIVTSTNKAHSYKVVLENISVH